MKRSDLFFAAFLVPIDFLLIIAAGSAAYFLRFQTFADIRPIYYLIPFSTHITYVVLFALCTIPLFALNGLYSIGHYRIRNEVSKIFMASSTSMMFLIIVIFFSREFFQSRFIVLAGWVLMFLFVLLGRTVARLVKIVLFKNKIGTDHIILLGSPKYISKFSEYVKKSILSGYEILGEYSTLNDLAKQKILESKKGGKLNALFIVDPTFSRADLQHIYSFSSHAHISLYVAADSIGSTHFQLLTLAGMPFIEIRRTPLEGWGRILKRMMDIICASILFVLTLPIVFLVAVAIKLESPGPIFYKNERVGHQGKTFLTYKLRSMYIQYCTGKEYDPSGKTFEYELKLAKEKSERKGPVFKILHDPRRTRVGRFIERFSIDELPQLINVLRGEMSLVGPRPHMPIQVAHYADRHNQLFHIKPGLTGLAQVEGRSDLDFEDEARLDTYYIEHWSLFLDSIILLKTPFVVLTRKSHV